jgi:predicted nucleotidyltransferase
MDSKKVMERNKIVEMYAGSRSYGTSLPTSDVDIRGIFVADPVSIRTPFFHVEEVELPDGDTKYFELNKFMKLAMEQNPNIVELLWTSGPDIIMSSPAYELLRQARGNLLTSKVAFTTTGYALSQLKRIKGHKKWITSPQPEREPEQLDFVSVVYNFTSTREWNKTVPFKGYEALELGDNHFGLFNVGSQVTWRDPRGNPIVREKSHFDALSSRVLQIITKKGRTPDIIVKVNKRQFDEAHENWVNYWTWKKNRNETRSALEEQHGYDTKHAMHLVRLLRMGVEALTDGVINVRRTDAAELLSIRAGNWTYDQVIDYAEHTNDEVQRLVKTTSLPKDVNHQYVANLIIQVQDMVWGMNPSHYRG